MTPNWDSLATVLGPKRTRAIREPLEKLLPTLADATMAINNLERLVPQLPTGDPNRLFDSTSNALETILPLLATSQLFADTLVNYPDSLALVLEPQSRNPSTYELVTQLRARADAAPDDASVLRVFRRFRQMQILRIGMHDVIHERPLEEITRELARLADASLEVALHIAMRNVSRKFGTPATKTGRPARIAGFAFGKLGGDELNYSSDLDLMFVYDDDGETIGKRVNPISNADFYTRVVTELIRLLSSHTDHGFAYRIDLRLRPEGKQGPLVRTLASTRSYYDVMGRTWERQALIKLRPCAGHPELGQEFMKSIESFVYRKYFSFSEINEVKMLKRQMEQRAIRSGDDDRDVKTGHGGIRDIEYAIQFLQLLNGGDLPAVRQRNTLLALEALEIAGCLTPNETYILADAYRFLRKTEHRLQLLFDLQTHRLPESPVELRKLALRMGYTERSRPPRPMRSFADADSPTQRRAILGDFDDAPPLAMRDLLVDPLDLFLQDLREKTQRDRSILDHLLHQTFGTSGEQHAEPETDLILDPDPNPDRIRRVLGRYPFKDHEKAYFNLSKLARESVRFLSHRRCRHFFASIAPQVLNAIAETPDPDAALDNLEQVTASLGAKAVLYELFSFSTATLKLYVDLCSGSPFLSSLMINNPGMVDELLDSLVLDQPRSVEELRLEVAALLHGAIDPDPILHSFRDKELLRVGVADLLGQVKVRETTANLSDVAEAILDAAFALAEPALRAKFGEPCCDEGDTPCRYAVVGLGKLGGREISYNSDLDVMLIYESIGTTRPTVGARATANQHYFTELLQKAIQQLTRAGPMGKLYAVDVRLRPTGKSGALVLPMCEFERYFADGGAQLWERLALTRGRVVRAEASFAERVRGAMRTAVVSQGWQASWHDEIRAMRGKLEANTDRNNVKRGVGGLVDIEFIVQSLMLRHGAAFAHVLQPNSWDAIRELRAAGIVSATDAMALDSGYTFLRTVESRLRIVTDRSLVTVPDTPTERTNLARRLGFESATAVVEFDAKLVATTQQNRALFTRLVGS
jgi:[glutamine synthetase] adenylyltransferase / [glutamine synthetase]-adenylyl-L-tyrosine phosphorylase